MKNIFYILLFFVFIQTGTVLPKERYKSNSLQPSLDSLAVESICPDCKDLVLGSGNGPFPVEVQIIGKIVDVSPAYVQCGTTCNSGTVSIKITENLSNYPSDTIYVSVLCLYGRKCDFLGKLVEIDAELLTVSTDQCYRSVMNKIDSKGVPFYCTDRLLYKGLNYK